MRAVTAWRLCAVLGLGVAVLSIILLPMFPSSSAEDLSGYGGPVFAFEAAKTPADLIAVFGPADDPERAVRIAQMDKGNLWDFPFMALYSLFTAAFFAGAFLQSRKRVWIAFAAIGLLSGIMDAWENVILLGITADLAAAPHLATLAIPVWSKFFAIMFGILGAGAHLVKQPTIIWKILGGICIIGALTIPIAYADPASYGWLIKQGVAAGWIIMSLYAYAICVDRFGT